MVLFIWNSRKDKPIYSNKSFISGFLVRGSKKGWEGRIWKGHFWEWWICFLSWLLWLFHRCKHLSKFSNYILNMGNLLYVYYAFIKLFLKNRSSKLCQMYMKSSDFSSHKIFISPSWENLAGALSPG